jgi:hypothetical protein
LSDDFDADSAGFDDEESLDVEVDPLEALESFEALDSLAALPLLLPASEVDFLA